MTKLIITPGEPGGIGPDCTVLAAMTPWPTPWVAVADPDCLRDRAKRLDCDIDIVLVDEHSLPEHAIPKVLFCLPEPLKMSVEPGEMKLENASYVLNCLQRATDLCLSKQVDALVTGPINKAVINDAGIAFSGHTEWLASHTQTKQVVMLLATEKLRVALMTTHLPLRKVPDAITAEHCQSTLKLVHDWCKHYFTINEPRIHVLGLNPHAGEGGHMGDEEEKIIGPCIAQLNQQGFNFIGPLSADTAFVPEQCARADVFVAMYHDQGLPVIKQVGFGSTVNVTLGLPIIRTSVDHGTAHSIAGTKQVNPGSLISAMQMASQISERVKSHDQTP